MHLPYYHIAPHAVYKIVSHFKSSNYQHTFAQLLDAEGNILGSMNMRGDAVRQTHFNSKVAEREKFAFINWVAKFHHTK